MELTLVHWAFDIVLFSLVLIYRAWWINAKSNHGARSDLDAAYLKQFYDAQCGRLDQLIGENKELREQLRKVNHL